LSNPRIDRLIALTERLTLALKADIAALERGRPREMRTIAPENQQLTALFIREAAAFNAQAAKAAPADKRARLVAATRQFKDVLALQTRMVRRMRTVSEGMIRAIAEDVARKRNAAKPYAPMAARPRAPGAMVYNGLA
jgi:capsid protein